MQYYTKTLDRSRDKNSHKLNRLKKSESLREKLSCVGVYENYEKPESPKQEEYNESERSSYLQLLKGSYISNSTRHLPSIHHQNTNTNFNTMGTNHKDDKTHKDTKHKKLVYADLALGNHNLKFKNTVNSNRHLYGTYSISNADLGTNRETNHAYNNGGVPTNQRDRKNTQPPAAPPRTEYATLKFNEIDV